MTSPITHENIIEVLHDFAREAEHYGDLRPDDSVATVLLSQLRRARDLYQRLQAEKEGGETKPVLCIGLETLTLLARNKELNLENVALIPADSFPYALFAPPASGTDSSGRATDMADPSQGISAWQLRRLADGLAIRSDPVSRDAALALRFLADAAGQAAPVPPPVEGLETTEKERDDWAYVFSAPEDQQMFAARFHRDFGRLAKEVERLKEEVRIANNEVVANSVSVGIWMKRAGAAEATLAVYEAPLIDAEVEALTGRLRNGLLASAGFVRDSKNAEAISAMQMAINDVDSVGETFRRLSAAHAECKGANTKLREAARRAENWFAAFGFNQHGIAVKDDFEDHEEIRSELRAALAHASGEKAR